MLHSKWLYTKERFFKIQYIHTFSILSTKEVNLLHADHIFSNNPIKNTSVLNTFKSIN